MQEDILVFLPYCIWLCIWTYFSLQRGQRSESGTEQLNATCEETGYLWLPADTQATKLSLLCMNLASRVRVRKTHSHTHLLFVSRKRGSSRADTEYRVVISGGWYGVSSPPSCTAAASTPVPSGTVKECSLWSVIKRKSKGLVNLNDGLSVWISARNFFKLGRAWLTLDFSSPPPQCSPHPWSVLSHAQGYTAAAWPVETWTTVG